MKLTTKQQALIDYLKKNKPDRRITLTDNGEPNGRVIFQGTPEQLESFWKAQ